jgi:hypothetical protein
MPTPIITNVTFIPNLAVGTQWEHSPEAMRCVAEQGAKVKDAAETIVPVDTGALRDSIELLVEGIATVATAWVDKAERDDAQAWNYLTLEECNEVIKRLNGAYPG